MIAYGGRELASAFRTVRRNTVQVAEDIPEGKYDYEAAPGVRSVSATLRHILFAPRMQEDMHRDRRLTTLKGYDFGAIVGKLAIEEKKPASKAEIIKLLTSEGERTAKWLESLTPEFLAETFTDHMGEKPRTRFENLLSVKEHEMHHRAQLMVVERLLGIVPHLTREREERRQRQAAAATATAARV